MKRAMGWDKVVCNWLANRCAALPCLSTDKIYHEYIVVVAWIWCATTVYVHHSERGRRHTEEAFFFRGLVWLIVELDFVVYVC